MKLCEVIYVLERVDSHFLLMLFLLIYFTTFESNSIAFILSMLNNQEIPVNVSNAALYSKQQKSIFELMFKHNIDLPLKPHKLLWAETAKSLQT